MENGFGKSFFGYKKEDVERIISKLEMETQQRISALEEELGETRNKLRDMENAKNMLQKRLDEANKKESAMVDLLIAAREKAMQIEQEAEARAARMLQEIDSELEEKKQVINEMRGKYDSFQNEFKGLLGRYTGMLGHLPELVFVDDGRALPPGSDSSIGLYQKRLPPAGDLTWAAEGSGGEDALSATEMFSEDAWTMPAADGRPFKPDAEPVSEDRWQLPARGAEEPGPIVAPAIEDKWQAPASLEKTFLAAAEAADTFAPASAASPAAPVPPAMTPDDEQILDSGELNEFRRALNSLNKLTYEPTVEEPWAAPMETPAQETSTQEPPQMVAPQPAETFIPAADSKYKPFTPFAKKTDPEVPPVIEKSVLSPAPAENDFGLPPIMPPVMPPAGLEPIYGDSAPAEPVLEKSMFANQDEVADREATEDLPPIPAEKFPAAEPAGYEEETTQVLPKRPLAEEDKGSGLPYKPWDAAPDKAGTSDSQQPFAEGGSLKDLLERHRQEMQRKNQKDETGSNGTLRVDVSEEDKKFWS